MPDQRRNVFVVDDDAEMSLAIERLLKAAGLQAVTYTSAEALLEGGVAASAGCLILDIHLPGLSGLELHRRLRHSGIETPVIFITAHDDLVSRTQAQEAGAIAYLTKPFLAQRLLTAVARAMGPG